MQIALRELVRRRDRGQYLLRAEAGICWLPNLWQQEQKLIPAVAADSVRAANDRLQTSSDRLKKLVAHLMAEGVVDVFEAIEVQKQHGEACAATMGERNRLTEPIVQEPPIRQVGEHVALRQTSDSSRHVHESAGQRPNL